MNKSRIKNLERRLTAPLLIKKPENLLYLLGQSVMYGYLLVKNNGVVFFGDGLESPPTGGRKIKTDRLKNIALYLSKERKLQLEDQFTFAEYNYIKAKIRNPSRPALSLRERVPRSFAERAGRVRVTCLRSPVDFLRQVKDQQELGHIRASMRIVEKVFVQVKKQLRKKTWTETALAAFIKSAGLKLGAEDVSFPPIVASGANAAVPHHVPSAKKLKAGESIIIDFGFKYKNYCSDFTRTVFIRSVPKRLEIAYKQVEKAYNESIAFVSLRGVLATKQSNKNERLLRFARNDKRILTGDVYQKSVDVLAEERLEKYFIHSLGHGTGLEIHELPNLSPKSKDELKSNMVFSIEPGVYIPKLGGIRIEDLVYLKAGSVKKFINVSTKLEDNIF